MKFWGGFSPSCSTCMFKVSWLNTDSGSCPASSLCSDSQVSADLCNQDGPLVTTTATGTGTGVAVLQVIQARPVWPSGPALTARLRRLITAYQRFTLRREPLLRHDFLLHDGLVGMPMGGGGASHGHHSGGPLAWQLGEELRRCSVASTDADPLFLEWQRRWSVLLQLGGGGWIRADPEYGSAQH